MKSARSETEASVLRPWRARHPQGAFLFRKKSATNLHILMNWQKQGADWKLLSRAATKL
jgi:hypothetical protein